MCDCFNSSPVGQNYIFFEVRIEQFLWEQVLDLLLETGCFRSDSMQETRLISNGFSCGLNIKVSWWEMKQDKLNRDNFHSWLTPFNNCQFQPSFHCQQFDRMVSFKTSENVILGTLSQFTSILLSSASFRRADRSWGHPVLPSGDRFEFASGPSWPYSTLIANQGFYQRWRQRLSIWIWINMFSRMVNVFVFINRVSINTAVAETKCIQYVLGYSEAECQFKKKVS